MKRRLVSIGIAAVLSLGLGACGTPKSEAPIAVTTESPAVTPQVPGVGDSVPVAIEGTVGTLTIDSVRRVNMTVSPDRHESGSYLVAAVTLNVTQGALSLSGYDFTATGADGVGTASTFTPLDDVLDDYAVAGRPAHGEIAFDVPAGDTWIDWAPGELMATWKVFG